MALANLLQGAPTLKATTLDWPVNRRQRLGAQISNTPSMSPTVTPDVAPQLSVDEERKKRRVRPLGEALGPVMEEKLGGA